MNNDFKNTHYFDSLWRQPINPLSACLVTGFQVRDKAENELHYQYVNIGYEDFSKTYPSKGWEGRKISALPMAFWSIIDVISHLSKALLSAKKDGFSDNLSLKAHLFSATRDLEEGLGQLVTLINDRFGSYLIQEAQFHKTCYNIFLQSRSPAQKPPKNPPPVQKKTEPKKTDDSPLEKARTLLEKNQPNQALQEIEKFSWQKNDEKETFLIELASYYREKGNAKEALTEIEKIVHKTETKELFLASLAEDAFDDNALGDAFDIIKKIVHNDTVKEEFLSKLANQHRLLNDPDQATTVINTIIHNREAKEKFLLSLANDYLEDPNLEKAYETIKKIVHDTEEKEKFLHTLAEQYRKNSQFKKAWEVVKDIVHDLKQKDNFLIQLFNDFFGQKDYDTASKVLSDIDTGNSGKESLQAKLAQAFYDQNNKESLSNFLKNLARDTVFDQCRKEDKMEHLLKKMKEKDYLSKIAEFSLNLSKQTYNEVEDHFKQKNSLKAIQLMKTEFRKNKHLESSLNL